MPDSARTRPGIGSLTVIWGTIWSIVLGAVLLAPRLLAVHHLRPAGVAEWAMLDLVLVSMFALVGTIVSAFGLVPMIAWRQIRGRAWPRPAWLAALASLPLVAAFYVGAGFAVSWTAFGRGMAIGLYRPLLVPALALVAASLVPVLVFYRRLVCAPSQARAGRFAVALVGTAVAAFLALPLRVGEGPLAAESPKPDDAMVRATAAASGHRPPLLFVGLDSGNWATLQPLLAQHRLPAIGRLIASGIHAPMKAEWQPYFWSRPAWAAILTGYDREETGIHEDLAAHIPGLSWFHMPLEFDPVLGPLLAVEYIAGRSRVLRVAPPPRTMLHRTPFWELLEERGDRTAVVRFDFSYPANGTASVVISNRVGHDAWDLMNVLARQPLYPVVAPEKEAAALLAPFESPAPADPAEWARLAPPGPHTMPRDAVIDPERILRIAYEIDRQSFDATERIIRRHRDLSAVALYLPGFDGICHAFWPYRFPGQYPDAPPDPKDVERLGSVIDRYLEFTDARLARLLALYDREPNVIIVSDHGHTAITSHPFWRGWHGPEAIFIASGPSFPHSDTPVRVSYFDIAPTILAVEHVPAQATLPGHPVMQPPTRAQHAERSDEGVRGARARPLDGGGS